MVVMVMMITSGIIISFLLIYKRALILSTKVSLHSLDWTVFKCSFAVVLRTGGGPRTSESECGTRHSRRFHASSALMSHQGMSLISPFREADPKMGGEWPAAILCYPLWTRGF
jgi:hypothetical protein